MSRILVVYYSRSGTTRQAATAIAEALGADVEELVDRRDRSGPIGYARSGLDGLFGRLTELQPPRHRPEDYDLVVFGSPVWAASLSAPVRTYLRRYYDDLEEVAFFCTCGGRGGERVLRQMADLCRDEPTAAVVFRQREVVRGSFHRKVGHFARALKEALGELERTWPGETKANEAHAGGDEPVSTLADAARDAWENEGGAIGKLEPATELARARARDRAPKSAVRLSPWRRPRRKSFVVVQAVRRRIAIARKFTSLDAGTRRAP